MKTKIIDQNTTETIHANKANTTYVLARGTAVTVDDQFGIEAVADAKGRSFQLNGHISGSDIGMAIGSEEALQATKIVLGRASGIETDSLGLLVFGNHAEITNRGDIAAAQGLFYFGKNGTIENSGNIESGSVGVTLAGKQISLHNTGFISGPTAVAMIGQEGERLLLRNDGFLVGERAVIGGDGEDTVINNGGIRGNVSLGGGNDIYRAKAIATGIVDGQAGRDILRGGSNQDTLAGGGGADILTGGGADDTFIFRSSFGKDTITDFRVDGSRHDLIDLSAQDLVTSFDDLAGLMHKDGRDTIIDFGGGDILRLDDVKIGELTADHFVFL